MDFKLSEFLISLLIAGTTVGVFAYGVINSKNSRLDSFKNAKTVLCPSAYEFVHGDGFTSFDRSTPLVRTIIKVTLIKDGYIYDDKNNAFSIHECIVKN